MKLKIFIISLICILLFTSCDAQSFFDLMKQNQYNEWGIYEQDTTLADTASNIINNLETQTVGGDEVLKPLSKADKEALKGSISALSQSDVNSDKFVEDMNKKVTDSNIIEAAKKTAEKASALVDELGASSTVPDALKPAIDNLKDGLDTVANSSELTQAQLLQAQLIVEVLESAENYSDPKADDGTPLTDPEDIKKSQEDSVKDLINDTQILIDATSVLSGDFDLITDLNIGDIISGLTSKSSTNKIDEYIEIIASLDTFIYKLIQDDDGKFCKETYEEKMFAFRTMIAAYDNLFAVSYLTNEINTNDDVNDNLDINLDSVKELAEIGELLDYLSGVLFVSFEDVIDGLIKLGESLTTDNLIDGFDDAFDYLKNQIVIFVDDNKQFFDNKLGNETDSIKWDAFDELKNLINKLYEKAANAGMTTNEEKILAVVNYLGLNPEVHMHTLYNMLSFNDSLGAIKIDGKNSLVDTVGSLLIGGN